MIQLKKTILTLVALLAVTTGAWAAEETVTWEGSTLESIDVNSYGTTKTQTIGDITITANSGYFQTTTDSWTQSKATTASAFEANGLVFSSEKNIKSVEVHASDDSTFGGACIGGVTSHTYTLTPAATSFAFPYGDGWLNITKIVFTLEEAASAASSGPKVAWDKDKKTGTFTMPGGNVTLEPEYYDLATLADNGLTAAVDAAAKTEAPLAVLAENAVTGGTLMYFVIYDENFSQADAIALAEDEWEAAIPTAETIDEAGSYYVWYYIKGDDEHSDTDPQRLAVTVLPEPTYAVTFADGVNPEPPAEPEWTASPATGVKKGETVTVTYTGPRKVMGVKAEKKREAKTLAEATSEDIGKIAGADGNIYDSKDAAEAANTTAVAMIAYVGTASDCAHGLAIALADEGLMNWATAKSTCEAKTPAFTGSTWKLPSQDEWKQMFSANGGNEESYDGLNTAITTAGGTAFQDGTVSYWSSSEYDSDQAHLAQFYYGYPLWFKDWKVNERYVRACLAF